MPVSFPVADHRATAVQVKKEWTAEQLLDDTTIQTNAAAKMLQFALGGVEHSYVVNVPSTENRSESHLPVAMTSPPNSHT
jgi:hypothetical protein